MALHNDYDKQAGGSFLFQLLSLSRIENEALRDILRQPFVSAV